MVSKESYESIEPIEVKVLPFQQTSQPEAFNIGIFSSATFMGMIFVLVPVSLAVDMVYDREVSYYVTSHVDSLFILFYFFLDKSQESIESEWTLFLHVFHNVLHRSSCDYGANLSSVVSDSITFRYTVTT